MLKPELENLLCDKLKFLKELELSTSLIFSALSSSMEFDPV